jgi:hypothetical protein
LEEIGCCGTRRQLDGGFARSRKDLKLGHEPDGDSHRLCLW